MEHWKEDWLFGYQCLNGSNPRMIQRCKKLPEKFPVIPDMVQRSMPPRTNLEKELKVGKSTIKYLSLRSVKALLWYNNSNLQICLPHYSKLLIYLKLSQSMYSLCSMFSNLNFINLSCPGREYLLVRLCHHGWDSHQHNQG